MEKLHDLTSSSRFAEVSNNKKLVAQVHNDFGDHYYSIGLYQKSIEHLEMYLTIAKEIEKKDGEGTAYGKLGSCYGSLSQYDKAIQCLEICLTITKENGDKREEGAASCNLGFCYSSLGQYGRSMEYLKMSLDIAKKIGNKYGEGIAYGKLGSCYSSLGQYNKAIDYHKISLVFPQEIGHKEGVAVAYGNLGNCYNSLSQYAKAIQYHEMHLTIAKEIGYKIGEGTAYSNLGACYVSLGQYDKAITYLEIGLIFAEELGDKKGKGVTYNNLGTCYSSLGQYDKAIKYHEMLLTITKEIGDKEDEVKGYSHLGNCHFFLGHYDRALSTFMKGVECCEELFENVPKLDECKVSVFDTFIDIYKVLLRTLLAQEKIHEALIIAEKGRSRALADLMLTTHPVGYGAVTKTKVLDLHEIRKVAKALGSTVLYFTLLVPGICTWIIQPNGDVMFHKGWTEVSQQSSSDEDLISLNHAESHESMLNFLLKDLYQILLKPVRQYVVGSHAIVVPHGQLALLPFAALVDENGHYVSDSLHVRLIPSLTTAKMIRERPKEPAGKGCPLIIGDPDLDEVKIGDEVIHLERLPYAKTEIEEISKILEGEPLVGGNATKENFLQKVESANLIHIAAHGDAERGEILLASGSDTDLPYLKDIMLTIADLEPKRIKAELVVLSCCHSGCGNVKAEGVVGTARAFLGAGARAVLVTLWEVNDQATLGFMYYFYKYLKRGKSANEALNKAMKTVRKEKPCFRHPFYWAPFALLGEDVTPFPKR